MNALCQLRSSLGRRSALTFMFAVSLTAIQCSKPTRSENSDKPSSSWVVVVSDKPPPRPTEPGTALATTRKDYVGTWEGSGKSDAGDVTIRLTIRANGELMFMRSERRPSGAGSSVEEKRMIIVGFGSMRWDGSEGPNDVWYVTASSTTFGAPWPPEGGGVAVMLRVDSPPARAANGWSMTVDDGVVLKRVE